jgi:hypothetical protein
MNQEIASFGPRFEAKFREAQRFAVFVRGREFQESAISDLGQLLTEIQAHKQRAIDIQDEDSANGFLAFELMCQALQKEILCYVKLKGDEPGEAWDALVDAESCIRDAVKAHPLVRDASGWLYRIEALQKQLFPEQRFLSTGWRVTAAICSICERQYEECEHILGRSYMGKMCYQIVTEAKILEISLVERPSDKHCRVTSISERGESVDPFTLRRLPDPPEGASPGLVGRSS